MFLRRIRNYPAPGKVADMRAGAEEATRARHAEGTRCLLATVVFGDVPSIDSVIWYDDLAACQASIEKARAAPDFEAGMQRLAANTRQPGLHELWELIVPFPANSSGPAARFVLTNTIVAVPGNGLAVRAALTDYVQARQKAGMRNSLYASVSGPARFLVAGAYSSMAAIEESRRSQRDSPELAAFMKASAMFAAPPNMEIVEILLQNP